jgi:hypothetical protein
LPPPRQWLLIGLSLRLYLIARFCRGWPASEEDKT